MSLTLALTLQAVWSPTKAAPADSLAAAAIYVEACLQGQLKLTKERGRILPANELPDFAEVLNYWKKPTKRTIVKFSQPSETYLVFAEYENASGSAPVRSCILVSRNLNGVDAERAFMVGSEGMKPVQTWWPNMYFPEWKIDARKLGYFKRMRMQDNRSILLEYSMYRDAQAGASASATSKTDGLERK